MNIGTNILIGVAVALIIALIAIPIAALVISVPVLDEGVVTAKKHEDASRTYMFRKVGSIHMMQPIDDDEDWVLVVKGTTEDGEERVERWEVSRETYEQTEIGDTVYKEARNQA